jgi:hypothetical protein
MAALASPPLMFECFPHNDADSAAGAWAHPYQRSLSDEIVEFIDGLWDLESGVTDTVIHCMRSRVQCPSDV